MLNFTIFGFPVRVHWMFWLVAVLLSGALGDPGRDALIRLVTFAGVVFVSILWHEIGHGLAFRKYGSRPTILLYGMGGLCSGSGRFTRGQSMFISAAGPAASLFLFAVAWVLWHYTGFKGASRITELILFYLLWINGFWTLVNLLPVVPLDGGHIFQAFMANKKPQIVPVVGAITAVAVAICALVLPKPPMVFLAILFGYLAFTNYQRSQGVHRGGNW